MNLSKKLIFLPFLLVCLNISADELSADLQKACIKEQLSSHKGLKGHPLGARDFTGYCKCETDFITEKATKEQLNEISEKPNLNPNWLKQLKSSVLKSCIRQSSQSTV
jgi:hypothetical protein